jgi:peroxiredoxin
MHISPRALNLVANISLVVAAGTLGVAAWYKYHHSPAVSVPGPHIQLGSSAPVLPGISYASHDGSLLLFLSTTCHYCQDSVPFYNKLHAATSLSKGKWNVIGIFPQAADLVAAFKTRANLQPRLLPDVDFRRFGVRSTPTVMLVDPRGIVSQVWVGASRANESAISAMLESLHVN